MSKSQKTRQANGASSIFQGKDGCWYGYVTVGVKDDGTSNRRTVCRKTRADVTKAVRDLERLRKVTADTLPYVVDQLRRSAWSRAAA